MKGRGSLERRARILAAVFERTHLRRRLTVLVSVLLLLICVAALAATCVVCVSSHPPIEQTVTSVPQLALPPFVVAWSLAIVLELTPLMIVRAGAFRTGRASPAGLRRFLFRG